MDSNRHTWFRAPWPRRALAFATGCYGVVFLFASHHPRPEELLARVSTVPLPSDKLLHFAGYGVLGLLAGATLVAYRGRSLRRAVVLGVALAVLGAISEILQPWSGRNAEFLDWLSDFAGLVAGIAIAVRYVGVAWPSWLSPALLVLIAGSMLAAAEAAGQAVTTADAAPVARSEPPAAVVTRAIERQARGCGATFLLGLVTPLGLATLGRWATGRMRPLAWAAWLAVAGGGVAVCLRLAWNHWPSAAAVALATIPAGLAIILGDGGRTVAGGGRGRPAAARRSQGEARAVRRE